MPLLYLIEWVGRRCRVCSGGGGSARDNGITSTSSTGEHALADVIRNAVLAGLSASAPLADDRLRPSDAVRPEHVRAGEESGLHQAVQRGCRKARDSAYLRLSHVAPDRLLWWWRVRWAKQAARNEYLCGRRWLGGRPWTCRLRRRCRCSRLD